jgi:hypothetical protein
MAFVPAGGRKCRVLNSHLIQNLLKYKGSGYVTPPAREIIGQSQAAHPLKGLFDPA